MKLHIDTLIIGAGYAGLLVHKKIGKSSIIVERGYSHQYSDRDYVVVAKKPYEFTKQEKINIKTLKYSSGAGDFTAEFARKVYNKEIPINTYYKQENQVGYPIDNQWLLNDANVYGNIDITHIDINQSAAHGRVLHLNKDVTIYYDKLVSTVPVHEFQKMVDMNFLDEFGMFISYFPVGIKKVFTPDHNDDMLIEYFSDPNIPFYRKQHHGNSIFYEYCLNKPFDDRFTRVVWPGKFVKIKHDIMSEFYTYFTNRRVFFAGRYATWDPDFLLDQIWDPIDTLSNLHMCEAFT